MENIKDIVNKVLGEISTHQPTIQSQIQDVFQNVLNPTEIKKISIAGCKDGDVLVFVESSAMMYQMNLRKPKLLKEFQEKALNVKNISFKIGKVL